MTNTTETSTRYTSPMPHHYDWTPSQIGDRTYPVTAGRIYGREVKIGDMFDGSPITAINFYTGFAGCPARYYFTTKAGGFVANA